MGRNLRLDSTRCWDPDPGTSLWFVIMCRGVGGGDREGCSGAVYPTISADDSRIMDRGVGGCASRTTTGVSYDRFAFRFFFSSDGA